MVKPVMKLKAYEDDVYVYKEDYAKTFSEIKGKVFIYT